MLPTALVRVPIETFSCAVLYFFYSIPVCGLRIFFWMEGTLLKFICFADWVSVYIQYMNIAGPTAVTDDKIAAVGSMYSVMI